MLDTTFYPPEFKGPYPHMFPEDIKIWERFLEKYGTLYNGFYYDVTVGQPVEVSSHMPENYKKSAEILSKLRIDAVGDRDESLDIIEVKPIGNMAALGQLLTYRQHYLSDYEPSKPVRMVLVASNINPNVEATLLSHGIVYVQV
jgi:hypothetical protein